MSYRLIQYDPNGHRARIVDVPTWRDAIRRFVDEPVWWYGADAAIWRNDCLVGYREDIYDAQEAFETRYPTRAQVTTCRKYREVGYRDAG